MFKPFKPPALLEKVEKSVSVDLTASDSEPEILSRPYKKRKLLIHSVEESTQKTLVHASQAVNAPRKPLLVVKNPIETKETACAAPKDGLDGYYMVLRKFTAKKHKTWDGDGVLSVSGGYARLQDISGREMGKTMFNDPLLPGSTLSVGGKDIEIDSIITKNDFLAGRPFLKAGMKVATSSESISGLAKTVPPAPVKMKPLLSKRKDGGDTDEIEISAKSFYASTHKSTAMKAQFKNPLLSTTVMPQNKSGAPTPRHDPDAPGALVMKRPTDCPKGKRIVDVVVDPFLVQHLRPHQREGIKFLYECVMGLRDFNGQGAVLADEMGLGKTLQTIALVWTLLKQNPIHGSDGVVKKVLIVCPVTVIANWKREFNKWLGNERIGVFVADNQKNLRLTDFTHGRSYSVMIIGYEKLRMVQDELKKGGGIDIVVADEGHRLKTENNKSAQAIRSLNTERRVVLSGTPIQNDLSEFFVMVDLVNPGLLGTYKTFKKEFELPIHKSHQAGASKKDVEKGSAREEEMSSMTKQFILRRTSELLDAFLPPKTEFVLFCRPTQAQAKVYQHVLESPVFGKVLGSSEASLQLITILKKVCNAPSLLARKNDAAPSNPNVAHLLEIIPTDLLQKPPVIASSKFRVLDRMLNELSTTTKEKIVLVSNYTATLDLLGAHLVSLNLPYLRLDGSTPSDKRQELVNSFNNTPASKNFAFLLSAKSGGVGLNLIGASRLVLFDVDWNPATDLQAMARIHRDGQKHPVKIYRFLMAGGMDEKIYQRQVSKTGLADSVVDGKKNEASFSAEELKDLFRLDLNAGCQTHDFLGCDCKGLDFSSHAPPSQPEAEITEKSDTNISVSDDEESDDDLPTKPTYAPIPASKTNIAAIERRIAKDAKAKRLDKMKGKMQALMKYTHIDTTVFMGETEDVFGYEHEDVKAAKEVIDDEVLVKVLRDERCKVGFVFAKKSKEPNKNANV
ncbi:DNA repair and recombination rad54B [Hyphodiscus hymeniophilus]|uniref:DNA repair and recombination rad54B n=1 Tax=Hyphodiscus hymeniophilus TaxID=353542 RepID=A0A9P6VFG5_9HELO|nr:DNA repair and recombination rad54B [Hyphodiscus hymeniophilus]